MAQPQEMDGNVVDYYCDTCELETEDDGKCLLTEVRDEYTSEEFIHPDLKSWTILFKTVIPRLLEETPHDSWRDGVPDGEFVIYRGGSPDGFSWTLSQKRAIWFAERFKPIGRHDFVYTMTVTKEEILWYNDSRNEQEVVLVPDPSKVKQLKHYAGIWYVGD